MKNTSYGGIMPSHINLFYKTMRISAFLLLFCTFCAFANNVNSQAARVTIKKSNVALIEVLNDIEKQTNYLFVYSNDVNVNRRVSVKVNKLPVEMVLDKIFDGDNVHFQVEGSHIILKKKVETSLERVSIVQQIKQVKLQKGKVLDDSGNPVIGASVVEKGTANGTITDINGDFTLSVEPNVVLQISYIGYKSQEIKSTPNKMIIITLKEEAKSLNEVVVVGYGTQKRANLTGAVDQVTSEVFENRPMTNVSQGLQGVIPNLNITLTDGKPMRSSDYNIRGTTSIGQGGSALVLIDGVEGDPAMLNPNDIASISVLKDASSAAIYGARGTFGVVLITTKKPNKERTTINYTGNVSVKAPIVVPNMVSDGYEFATRFQEAYSAWYDYASVPSQIHHSLPFNQDWYKELANHRPGSGQDDVVVGSNGKYQYFGNTDWYDLLYKDRLFAQDHSVTIQSGNEKANFMASGRYYSQDGLFAYNEDKYKMFNIRAKGGAQLYKWLYIDNNFEYDQMQYHNPLTVTDGNIWYGLESDSPACATMFNPDGTLTMAAAYSVGDFWYGKSGTDSTKRVLRNTTSFTAKFFNDALTIKGDITFRNTDDDEKTRRVPVPYSDRPGVISYLGSNTNDYMNSSATTRYFATNVYAEYSKLFNEVHDFKGMVGYNYEQSIYNYSFHRRNGLIFPDADNISLTNGSASDINGLYKKWKIVGGFFRFNYAYNNRYLLEVNGRLDGSSKFPTNQQWGFFPSVSAGWRISEEPFWKVSSKIISDMKLRFSFGSLGNGNIDPYTYEELFTIYQAKYLVGGKLNQATSSPTIIPDGLTWEKAITSNIGLDMGLLDGKLRFSGDYYIRKTKNMYTVGTTLPDVFGASSPKGNYADMTTKGWELSLTWRDQFNLGSKPFSYDVKFTMSDYTSKIDKYNNENKFMGTYYDARCEYYKGMKIGEIWGYVNDGYFTSVDEVKSHADQSAFFGSITKSWTTGDVKFRDLNDDKKITKGDNTINNPGDRKIIGNSTPRYCYSINLGANWNGIFFSAFFQGVGKQNWWPGTDNALFWGQYNRPYNNIPKKMLGMIWSEDNPNAYFPRYKGYVAQGYNRELSIVQTKYLQNVAYLRLKNLQVGYSFPKDLVSKVGMQAARVYLSAENIWTWSPLYKHTENFDVANIYGEDKELQEMVKQNGGKNSIIANGGQSYNYPALKSLSLGLSITF